MMFEHIYGVASWELTKEGFMKSFALFLVGVLETKEVATKYFYDICIFLKVEGRGDANSRQTFV